MEWKGAEGAALAVLVDMILVVHLTWIGWVIFGAIWTRGRPGWSGFHILALMWGITAEVGPWPCPLTLAEQWAMTHAGMQGFHGGFIEHYLEATVYPNLPAVWVITAGVLVCALNLGIYMWRGGQWWRTRNISAREMRGV